MGAFIVVVIDPKVQIILQLVDIFIDLFAERHLIELLQNGLVKPFADAVGLRWLDLYFGVLDVVDDQEQLVIVTIRPASQDNRKKKNARMRAGWMMMNSQMLSAS